jgi:RNA polymerase sigma-70 factor (ECF subfamily)
MIVAGSPRDPAAGALGALADGELDRLWLRGDSNALAELHRRYRAPLEAVAYRLLGNRADAEDVVQRIFLALPRVAFRGTSSLWTYLYRAAVNGAVNVRRAAHRRGRLGDEARSAALLDPRPGFGPDAGVLEGEILGAVARALLQVKPQHRRVLVLRIVWGLSNVEIAEQEGLPIPTVGTWLRRGREELRRALGPTLRELEESRS